VASSYDLLPNSFGREDSKTIGNPTKIFNATGQNSYTPKRSFAFQIGKRRRADLLLTTSNNLN
jgi:hypothetical protein